MKAWGSEADLCRAVVAWLRDQQWEVFQEVGTGPRADIVAVQSGRVWVIEAKKSFGFPVIEQAIRWRPQAHWVSVAVPRAPGGYARDLMKREGIGILAVERPVMGAYADTEQCALALSVTERLRPRLVRWVDRVDSYKKRRSPLQMLHRLEPEHKDFCEAGSNCGGHWTPFKRTCRNIQAIVRERPGIHLKELIERSQHHYRSDRTAGSSISEWCFQGKVPGVRCEREGRHVRFYPEAVA